MSDPVIFLAVMAAAALLGWIIRVEGNMISRREYEQKHADLEQRVRDLESHRE
jgi:hypothetical protein